MSRVVRRYFVVSGPDSRHLHDAEMFVSAHDARIRYMQCSAKAKQLVSISYSHRMSEGENRIVHKERFA